MTNGSNGIEGEDLDKWFDDLVAESESAPCQSVDFDALTKQRQQEEQDFEAEMLASSEDELFEVYKNYPKDTPSIYEAIGAENFFDGYSCDKSDTPKDEEVPSLTSLENSYLLKAFVYEEGSSSFVRVGYVEWVREDGELTALHLRFIPVKRLPTADPVELTVRVPTDELVRSSNFVYSSPGMGVLRFDSDYIQNVLANWFEGWDQI